MSISGFPFRLFAGMSIRTKLSASALATVVLALTVSLTVFVSARIVQEAEDNDRFAARVIREVSELDALGYEYLLLKDKRPKAQWQLKHRSFGRILAEYPAGNREQEVLLTRLRSNHEQTGRLFDALTRNVERIGRGDRDPSSLYDELKEGLTAQLLSRTEMMVNDASRFALEGRRLMDRAQRTGLILVTFSALLLILPAGVTFLLARGIGTSLRRLEEGTGRIAAGDLAHQVEVRGDDEISRLAVAFNAMAAKLKAFYHDLEVEIARRRQAQEALEQSHAELETRVEERTRELAAANSSLLGRTRELEAANRELEGFSYTVSHDLKAPLRAIDGFSRMLQRNLEKSGRLDGETNGKIAVIRQNVRTMGQLIEDLLAFSWLGRAPLRMADLQMDSLANKVITEQKDALLDRDLRVMVDTLPAAWGDESLLRQVFVNLISNAVKFTHPKGAAVIEVGGFARDGEQIYYVKDNGVGFDMRYRDKLFGVFQRLHDEFEGTGVGLAIVQRIVVRHGGRVWAEGKVGEGATFFFSLPERRPEEE